MSPVITTENLEFSYGDTPVLHGIDLSVEAGEVVCLLGPNGVGKTTLVENLLGSLTPTSGRVRVLGTDPRRAGADFWARVGLVQQSWTDHAKWRVRDQLEWIRSVQLTATSRVSGVDEVLDAVGLSEKADSRLSRLSGGQRRTIDFAAALMAAPELLVLDEPTNGLDPLAVVGFRDLLREVTGRGGAVLVTGHHFDELTRLADRVEVLHRGRIIDTIVPEEPGRPGGADLERVFFDAVLAADLAADSTALESGAGPDTLADTSRERTEVS